MKEIHREFIVAQPLCIEMNALLNLKAYFFVVDYNFSSRGNENIVCINTDSLSFMQAYSIVLEEFPDGNFCQKVTNQSFLLP